MAMSRQPIQLTPQPLDQARAHQTGTQHEHCRDGDGGRVGESVERLLIVDESQDQERRKRAERDDIDTQLLRYEEAHRGCDDTEHEAAL